MHKGVRCCVECGATSTPQWREGPMGPKTLCNACGVRRQRLLRKQQTANTARVPTAPVAAVQARRRAARQAPASLSDEFHYGSGSGSENSSDETTEVEWAPTVPASRQPIATPSRFRQPPVQDEPQDDCGSEEQSAAYDLLFLAGVDVSSAKQEGPNEAEDTDTRQQQQDEEEAVEHEEGGSGGNNWRQHHVRYSSHEHKPPHLSYYNAHVHHLPRHHNTRRNVSTARRSDDLYYYYEAGDRGQEGDLGHIENEERAEQQQRMGRGKGDVGVRKRRRVSSATPANRIRAQSVLPPSTAVTPSAEDLNEVSAHHHLPQSSAFSIDLSTLSLQSSGGAPAATPPPVCAAAPIPRGSTVYQLGPYGLRVQMPQNVPFFYHHNTSSTSYPHPLQHQLPTNQADFLLPGRLVPLQPLHPAPPGSAASASHHEDSPPEPSSLSPTAISLSPTQHLSPSVCGRFAAPSTVDSPPEPLPAQMSLTYQSALPPLQLPLPAVTARELEMLVHLQREFQRACLQLHQATAACEAVGSVVMERREAAESAREVATAASRLLASEVRAMADKYRLRDVLSELHGAMERGAEEDTLAAAAAMQHPVGQALVE